MKILLLSVMILTSLPSFAQSIEFIGGGNVNSFFDYKNNQGHFKSTYKTGYGYSFQVAIDEKRINKVNY